MSFTSRQRNVERIFHSHLDSLEKLTAYHIGVYSQYQEEQLFLNCMKKETWIRKPSGENCSQKARKEYQESYGNVLKEEREALDAKFSKARNCLHEFSKIPEPVFSECFKDVVKETQRVYQNF